MAGHNEEVQHENGLTPLQQTHALFQAKAQFLKAPREQLASLLDTACVPIGDLYYIQDLTATTRRPNRTAAEVPGKTAIEKQSKNRPQVVLGLRR